MDSQHTQLAEYLQETDFINFSDSAVAQYATENSNNARTQADQAIQLYYAVRDDIRYDPYSINLTLNGLRAGTTLATGRGWCVPKAILLAACCRFVGIPARLGYADVRNHLSTERMRKLMNDDPVFFWHGYTAIHIDGTWLKATPAFNIELCEKFQLKPLDFNGREDALFHSFDLEGNLHMEYVQYRGEFTDVPLDRIKATFEKRYPSQPPSDQGDFDQEVQQETSSGRKED